MKRYTTRHRHFAKPPRHPLFIFLLVISTLSSNPAYADKKLRKTKTAAEQLAQQISAAYGDKGLAKLDAALSFKPIKLVYEHSLDANDTVYKSFQNLAELEQWLQSQETDNLPTRKTAALQQCQKGMCHYAISGLSHNHLYLKGFAYASLNGKPAVKALYLLDGD